MKGRKGDALHATVSSTELKHIHEETEVDDDDNDLKPLSMILKPAEKTKLPTTAKGYTRQAEKAQNNILKVKKY